MLHSNFENYKDAAFDCLYYLPSYSAVTSRISSISFAKEVAISIQSLGFSTITASMFNFPMDLCVQRIFKLLTRQRCEKISSRRQGKKISFEGWPPLHLCDPISVPSLQIVDGSRVTSLATLHFSPSLLSTLEFEGQPWAPHYPPSRVSPFNTRWSALWLARCSKVTVIGSLSGSRLDSPSRPLTVPL